MAHGENNFIVQRPDVRREALFSITDGAGVRPAPATGASPARGGGRRPDHSSVSFCFTTTSL